jgi:hypothetical protein
VISVSKYLGSASQYQRLLAFAPALALEVRMLQHLLKNGRVRYRQAVALGHGRQTTCDKIELLKHGATAVFLAFRAIGYGGLHVASKPDDY